MSGLPSSLLLVMMMTTSCVLHNNTRVLNEYKNKVIDAAIEENVTPELLYNLVYRLNCVDWNPIYYALSSDAPVRILAKKEVGNKYAIFVDNKTDQSIFIGFKKLKVEVILMKVFPEHPIMMDVTKLVCFSICDKYNDLIQAKSETKLGVVDFQKAFLIFDPKIYWGVIRVSGDGHDFLSLCIMFPSTIDLEKRDITVITPAETKTEPALDN